MTIVDELSVGNYTVSQLKVVPTIKPGKEIVQFLVPPAPVQELKKIIAEVVNDIYKDRYITNATVVIQPSSTKDTFVDISVISTASTKTRTKNYPLKDIWLLRSTHKNDKYVSMTFSTPKFFSKNVEGVNQGNQLLLQVTFNTENANEYVITSALEVWKESNKELKVPCIHKVNSDRPFTKQAAVPLFERTLNLNAIYADSLSMSLLNATYDMDTSDIQSELWEAHKQYIGF